MIITTTVFREFNTAKDVFRQISKSRVSEHPSTVNILQGHKNLWNLHGSTFIIILHQFGKILFGKFYLENFIWKFSELKEIACPNSNAFI